MKTKNSKSLLLAYYGDDFTGSTDVMESLARAGLRTALFLRPPTPKQLAGFPGLRAFGIAGGSRTMSPKQMEQELPSAFRALQASGASFIHYKTCSTFDSSPKVGSIGKAIELGRQVFGKHVTPLVVGAPVLGRYVVFGNLFARSGLDSEPSRLDRHPTMSRHPVTPMDEADVRRHLGRQTKLPIELVDVLTLDDAARDTKQEGRRQPGRFRRPAADTSSFKGNNPSAIVLLDTLREAHLPVIGRFLSDQKPPEGQLFCAGSSGVEYALVAHWRETKRIGRVPDSGQRPTAAQSQIIAISGSCSPVTDRQIGHAVKNGFTEIACESELLADRKTTKKGVELALSRARTAFAAGKNVIFQSARGPVDPRGAGFMRAVRRSKGRTRAEKSAAAGEALGRGMALILEKALQTTGARRAIVCGGDTSTAAARALGVEALEFIAPVAPGAPLCRVHAPGRPVDGCEVVFKGGQVGRDSFFLNLSNAHPK
jgi:uncharacterized protein YgbK (DUF1537 family)